MEVEDATEYSESVGQIVGGSWRLVLLAEKQGIPKALNMNAKEWAKKYLGGLPRLEIEERKEAAKELIDKEGLSQRKTAEVLGVTQAQISRDTNVSKEPSKPHDTAEVDTNVSEPPPDPEAEQRRIDYNNRKGLYVLLKGAVMASKAFDGPNSVAYAFETLNDYPTEFEENTGYTREELLKAIQIIKGLKL